MEIIDNNNNNNNNNNIFSLPFYIKHNNNNNNNNNSSSFFLTTQFFENTENILNNVLCSTSIKIMTFNILANAYALKLNIYNETQNFEQITWSSRGYLIIQIITSLMPDILCFQEDDQYVYFIQKLKPFGYTGVYVQRPGKKDGCSIFWLKEKFKLLQKSFIDLNKARNYRGIAKCTRCTTNNVGILCLLQPLFNNNNTTILSSPIPPLAILNCHLTWNPSNADVKVLQTHVVLSALEKMTCSFSSSLSPSDFAIILCGDFNSLPDSLVYEYIISGKINIDKWNVLVDECAALLPPKKQQKQRNNNNNNNNNNNTHKKNKRKKLLRKNSSLKNNVQDMTIENNSSSSSSSSSSIKVSQKYKTPNFGHSLELKSAYGSYVLLSSSIEEKEKKEEDKLNYGQHEPPFTNYTEDFRGCLDYIFYTPNKLHLRAILETPSTQVMEGIKRLPHQNIPSDHVPLMAIFDL